MIGNIYISGVIGEYDDIKGVTLIDIVSQVKKVPDATEYIVHINSEGGLVDTGFDIYNYLRSLGKPITTIGSGIVASIATVIYMAGDTRKLVDGTKFMIHNPWGEIKGNASEMSAYADMLLKVEKQMLDFYKKALNLTEEAIAPLLRDEVFLNTEQLTALGFVTSEPMQVAAKAVINTKTNDKMNKEDKEAKGILASIEKMLKKFTGFKAKMVQDATGTEINFEELADGDAIAVGAKATIGGEPAEGEHVMPDGSTYVFVAGELTEIREAEEDAEMAALQQENDQLKSEKETLAAEKEAAVAEAAQAKAKLKEIEKDVANLKKQVMSKFSYDGKKNPAKGKTKGSEGDEVTDRAAGARQYLNNKKNK
ncbi:head maturation protease, ClpP-related [Flavobacterium coralii]|uniref:head maturation protease, ClpP-related n=1 Tax=Flavobacterium coralii TaxID=2838017 RepID=UPI000C3C2FA1|nr:hypothetical protein [Flavobacterium sp.]|tara:strand:- start:9979 stop:11079 length:1101 start_codon:yes stop_codon:yes gene_type:complete